MKSRSILISALMLVLVVVVIIVAWVIWQPRATGLLSLPALTAYQAT